MKIVEAYHVEVGGIKITLDQEAAFDLTGQLMDVTGMAVDLGKKVDAQEEIIELKDQKIRELQRQLEITEMRKRWKHIRKIHMPLKGYSTGCPLEVDPWPSNCIKDDEKKESK